MRKHKYNFREGDIVNGFTFVKIIENIGFNRGAMWICKHCGKEFMRSISEVATGITVSCGCKHWLATHSITHGFTRGRKPPSEYNIWGGIIDRCYNENNDSYHNYGGRGIKMCDKWRNDFPSFLQDVGQRPSMLHTIDRIDVNKGYEPGNIRWATRQEQRKNQRDAIIVEYRGVSKRLQDWCEELGLKYKLMVERIRKRGWSIERAFETPVFKKDLTYLKHRIRKAAFISHAFGFIR